jgi:hypothetical protein
MSWQPRLTLITNDSPAPRRGPRKRSHLKVVRPDGTLAAPTWRQDPNNTERVPGVPNQVTAFFWDACEVSDQVGTGRRDTALAFRDWSDEHGYDRMGERAFFAFFARLPEVADTCIGPKQRRAFNVVVAGRDHLPQQARQRGAVRLDPAAPDPFGGIDWDATGYDLA